MFQPLEAISADSDALREKRPELPGHADSSLHHVVVVILKHALEARRFFELENIPLFTSYIRQYEVYKHAFIQGLPVNAVKNTKTKAAWSDYETLMQELLTDLDLVGGAG
jgi:hypothetical protein